MIACQIAHFCAPTSDSSTFNSVSVKFFFFPILRSLFYLFWSCRERNRRCRAHLNTICIWTWTGRSRVLQHVHSIPRWLGCTKEMCLDSCIRTDSYMWGLMYKDLHGFPTETWRMLKPKCPPKNYSDVWICTLIKWKCFLLTLEM